MLDHNLLLKSDELFLVGNVSTDGSREDAAGLYARDTRYLSRFSSTINGARPELLSVQTHDATNATITHANPSLPGDISDLPPESWSGENGSPLGVNGTPRRTVCVGAGSQRNRSSVS
ncbi:MAG: hypothetical protein M3Q03_16800 [Chloroflexota bacterium]|nr:hypothetical protein [Chloroflexota bacterium]